MDELSPEERFAHDAEDVFVPRDLADGVPEDEIVAKLVALGWDEDRARRFVEQYDVEQQPLTLSPEVRARLVNNS